MTTPNSTPNMTFDLTTPEGMKAAQQAIRKDELGRFLELMSAFINQIKDDTAREGMEDALDRMKIINAE